MEIRANKLNVFLRLYIPLGILIAIDYFWHDAGFFGMSSWNFIIAIAVICTIPMLLHYHLTYLIIKDDTIIAKSGILSPKYEIAINDTTNITIEKQDALINIQAQKTRSWYGPFRKVLRIDLRSGQSIFINVTDMNKQKLEAAIDGILHRIHI